MQIQANQPLFEGHELPGYRIRSVLSSGGFSIVYLADAENGTPVAIKEYLPATLSLRAKGEVRPTIAEQDLPAFRYGMQCFFEEGKSLAGLAHSNIVRVLDFFRANETAYLVMRYERGRTLQDHVRQHRGPVKEEFVRRIMALLLNGLREVHANKLLHLDIKPGNIYVRNDGTPILMDFGAARQALTAQAPRLRPMYTPGYAAPEQYGSRESLGPWSDIYSVGATMYSCLAAAAPPPADQRVEDDKYIQARDRWVGKYSDNLLQTIDWCMRLDYQKRPQSVFALQKVLLRERDPTASLITRSAEFRALIAKLSTWRAGR